MQAHFNVEVTLYEKVGEHGKSGLLEALKGSNVGVYKVMNT